MDDLISRQDAVKSMTNAIWHYPNEMYAQLNSYEMAEALAKDGLMFIPSAQQWIPCSKKLPKERQWVLGAVENIHDGPGAPKRAVVYIVKGISSSDRELLEEKGDERAKYITSADEWGNNEVPYCWKTWGPMTYFGQQITAWIPLPEPYKGEQT